MKSFSPLRVLFRPASALAMTALLTSTIGCGGAASTTKSDTGPLQVAGKVETATIGVSLDGVLGARSALNPKDGSFYQAYKLEGQAGDVVSITARSSDFDAFLSFFTADGNLLASNDDMGPGSTDARVISRLPSNGTYWIIVSALERTSQGRFSLEVTPMHATSDVTIPGSTSAWLFPSGTLHPETQVEVMPFAMTLDESQLVRVRVESENFPVSITIVEPATN
jgi:hypothetical protein